MLGDLGEETNSSVFEPLLRQWRKWSSPARRRLQHWLDLSVPHLTLRWAAAGVLLFLYILRVYLLEGYYMITYALGIYLLNRSMDFISPLEDPEADSVGSLPVTNAADDEFKPFVRKLPEFKFWYDAASACVLALCSTLLGFLNVPVFWPILLLYFIALLIVSLKQRVQHMIKHRYIPLVNKGKPKFSQ